MQTTGTVSPAPSTWAPIAVNVTIQPGTDAALPNAFPTVAFHSNSEPGKCIAFLVVANGQAITAFDTKEVTFSN